MTRASVVTRAERGCEIAKYPPRPLLGRLAERVDGLEAAPLLWSNGHVFDALIAAYTAWLAPGGLEPPPAGFNVASGWIWFPKRSEAVS
jgi:hypothetical protein